MITIDGTPASVFHAMGKRMNLRMKKEAAESRFKGAILESIETDGETIIAYFSAADGLISITSRKEDAMEEWGKLRKDLYLSDCVNGLIKEAGITLEMENILHYLGIKPQYPTASIIDEMAAREGCGYIPPKGEEETAEYQFIYNERNWYTDFTLIKGREELFYHFDDTEDEELKELRILPTDTVSFDDSGIKLKGTGLKLKKYLEENDALIEQSYDNSLSVFSKMLEKFVY